MKILISKYALIALSTLFIVSCATVHHDVSESQSAAQQIAQQELEQLQNWSVRGKLAIISLDERKSANIAWQQHQDKLTMTLTTVVGTTIAKLSYDGEMATLTADGQTWQDPSPSVLIYRITGWEVPVESLKYWMKGQVNADLVSEYFDNGLVKSMTAGCQQCLPWQVSYNAYAEFTLNDALYTLPTSLRLEQSSTQTSLIMRIDQWKAKDV